MLRIVTDGAADLPAGWEKEFDIKIVPINIHFGEKTFIQYVDMDFDAFYKEVASNKNHPKTSQPSPHQFAEFYRNNFEKGETILSIHVTSKLSGTYASCVAAAEELKGEYNVIPFDSLNGSMGIAFLCRTARKMERDGKSVDEIIKRLEAIACPDEPTPFVQPLPGIPCKERVLRKPLLLERDARRARGNQVLGFHSRPLYHRPPLPAATHLHRRPVVVGSECPRVPQQPTGPHAHVQRDRQLPPVHPRSISSSLASRSSPTKQTPYAPS